MDNANKENIEANCGKAGSIFKGVTGKKFKFVCPDGCDKKPGNVIGNLIYFVDTAICKSAIHSGMMPASGGEITVEIANGLEAYESALSNGI